MIVSFFFKKTNIQTIIQNYISPEVFVKEYICYFLKYVLFC